MSIETPIQSRSIWGTVEMDAASRDFDYADYLHIHTLSGCKANPLKPEAYALVCQVLDMTMEIDALNN